MSASGTGRAAVERRRQSFTLIELLVAACLAAILAGAVMAGIAGGIRVWERASESNGPMDECAISLETFEKDVRNSISFYAMPWEGNATAIRFPVLVGVGGTNGASSQVIGIRKYFYDSGGKCLRRKAWVFPGDEPSDSEAEKMISSLDNFRFTYYYDLGQSGQGFAARAAWAGETNLPAGVGVELALAWGGQNAAIRRTVYRPEADGW